MIVGSSDNMEAVSIAALKLVAETEGPGHTSTLWNWLWRGWRCAFVTKGFDAATDEEKILINRRGGT